jgi:ribosomal-protein-alanine N-acetyltransferase
MPPAEFPSLETPRLHLREITEPDAPALFAIHSNAAHMQWFGADPLQDMAGALKLVALFAGWRQLANPGTRWGIELKGRPGLVGTCGLFGWNRDWRRCTLGYELAPQATGQGLMREALQAIIPWGLAAMQLNRIEALVHENNAASLGLLGKLGFVHEGRLRQVGFWNGRHHDMLQLSLLAAEWPSPSQAGALV